MVGQRIYVGQSARRSKWVVGQDSIGQNPPNLQAVAGAYSYSGALFGEGSCHTYKYQTRAQELYNMTFFTLVELFNFGQSHFH